MIVVKPIEITDAKLTSSTIAEPDTGETVWSAGTYNLGDQRIKTDTHRIYQVVADPSTTDDPTGANEGINANPPTWVDFAPTNKWAMFDTVNSTQSLETTQLVIEVTPGEITNSLAGFSIEGANDINITMDDPVEGEVYNRDIDMNDNSAVADWYFYYFAPVVKKSEFAVLDMPAYGNATITMTVDGNDIKFGNFVLGNKIDLGIANYGTSLQLLDFSRKETDTFGNITVVEGRNSKLVNYDVTVPRDKTGYVFNVLSSLTTTPAIWIGTDEEDDATLVFGYYRDTQINISTPSISEATLQIEGLV